MRTPYLLRMACCVDFNFIYDSFHVYAAFIWASFLCEVAKLYKIQGLEVQVELDTLASVLP